MQPSACLSAPTGQPECERMSLSLTHMLLIHSFTFNRERTIDPPHTSKNISFYY